MQKKINGKRLVELVRIFKEIHYNSSRTARHGNWFEIEPFSVDREFDDNYNDVFMMEIKPLLISLKKEQKENLSNIKTFLFDNENKLEYSKNYSAFDPKEYLNTIERSTSYSDYLTKLIDKNYIYYTRETLNHFCTKYLFNDYIALELVIEIKDIKLVKNYQYPQEKNRFDDIEYYWKIKQYDEVFERVYNVLPNFCQSYLGIDEIKKKKDFPEALKQIFGKIRKIILTHNIPKLSKILEVMNNRIDKIINEFNETSRDFFDIRSKFGKDQGITKENKDFENALEINKKVCSRMVIDLLKVIHNAMLTADTEKD